MAAYDRCGQSQSSCTEHSAKDSQQITVMFICDEWKSSKGGLSTFNREYAVNLAKTCPDIKVYCYVAQSDDQDRKDATKKHVTLLTAQKLPGNSNRHDWLKIPSPELANPDVVIGHGRKFGIPAFFIRRTTNSKWVQFLHVFCQDLGRHKASKSFEGPFTDAIHENEEKHKHEIELCEVADAVIAVGSELQRKYRSCLPDTKVGVAIPGILDSFPLYKPPDWRLNPEDTDEVFSIIVSGRAAPEDRYLKGYDIIADAVGSLGMKFQLEFVGSQPGEQRKLQDWFLNNTKIACDQLIVHSYVDQEGMRRKLKEHALFVLPSRTEAFGLAALEAISAGTPVLISKKAGIAQAIQKLENGNSFIVSSTDAKYWAVRIEELSRQKAEDRYEDARQLRENYKKAYPWDAACKKLYASIENLKNEAEKSAEPMADKENSNIQSEEVSSIQEASSLNKKQLEAAKADNELQNNMPVVVQTTLWRYIGEIFGKRPHTESRCLRWGDLSLREDPATGNERLIWNDAGSKPHQVQGELGNHNLQSVAVTCYKEFASHRPHEMNKPNSPFYLAVKRKRKQGDQVWYMNKPQAVNKIGKMEKDEKRPRLSL